MGKPESTESTESSGVKKLVLTVEIKQTISRRNSPMRRNMAAPKNNQFWKARSTHGRKPIFKTPAALLKACSEYFEWCEKNPLKEQKVFHFQGSITSTEVEKMRAMTIGGLCLFLDISQVTWFDYCKKDGFSNVTTRVNEAIRNQKFVGAAADLLNANIIARDLGLADKKELTGAGGGPIKAITTDMTPKEAADAYAETLDAS